MNPMTFVLVATIFWVITIFIALPIGIKIPSKPKIGHASSAPNHHRLGAKVLITLAISLAATFIYWYIIVHFPNIFDFVK